MKPALYLVIAYRWGQTNNHSYTVGIYSKKAKAIKAADDHAIYRGGKYTCMVEQYDTDTIYFDDDDKTPKTVYTTTNGYART